MSAPRHGARRRTGRKRLLIVLAAPLLALSSFAAHAAPGWAYAWNPPLDLTVHGTTANFVSLPQNMASLAGQKVTSSATFRTNWVDVRALKDGPNIAQQGLSIHPPQFKLQIAHGPNPLDHRGDCHIAGATGHILAYGPRIDVADGNWHTITCIKYPDSAHGTEVVVVVDGVAGAPQWSGTPIGDVQPTGAVRLGGRSAQASTDSLDGWISKLTYSVG